MIKSIMLILMSVIMLTGCASVAEWFGENLDSIVDLIYSIVMKAIQAVVDKQGGDVNLMDYQNEIMQLTVAELKEVYDDFDKYEPQIRYIIKQKLLEYIETIEE